PRSAELRRKSDCHRCLRFSSPHRFPIPRPPNRALRGRCRRDPLIRGFPSSGLSFLLPSMYAFFELCNRTAKIINQERVESPVGNSCQDAICWRITGRQQTKEGQPMSTSKADNQLKSKWIY